MIRIDTEEELADFGGFSDIQALNKLLKTATTCFTDGETSTYTRTGPDGVAREEADLARCQDLALRRQTAVNRITNIYDWEPLNLLRSLSPLSLPLPHSRQ